MKATVTYRIETRRPSETGLDRTAYDVIGSWRDEAGRPWTNGVLSYRGCDTLREAKTMLRVLRGEHPFVSI